jgi:hypothetical protein
MSMNLTTRELRPPSFIQVEIYFLLLLFSSINVIIFSFLIYKILLSKILIVHVSKIYCFVRGRGVVVYRILFGFTSVYAIILRILPVVSSSQCCSYLWLFTWLYRTMSLVQWLAWSIRVPYIVGELRTCQTKDYKICMRCFSA